MLDPSSSPQGAGPSTGTRRYSRRRLLGYGASAMALAGLPGLARAVTNYKGLDVIVVGAGLSGLHAACLLQEQGLNVLTLEGRNRIGGRVYTLMDVPGRPEAGGEWMGANYARMIDTARRLGLEMLGPDEVSDIREWCYRIRGEYILAADWPDHPLNPMQGDDRQVLPNRMLFTLSHKNNPLSGQPLDAWIRPEFARFDIPQTQYLKEYLGFNEETIRLMNVVIHTDHMDNTSALHEMRRYAVGEFSARLAESRPDLPAWRQIKGGNSRLPEAMAASLENPVELNKTVYAFEDSGGEVTAHCMDGTRYTARQVICSMPYPVLRKVKFAPRLPQRMERAIEEIDYGTSIQVHFLLRKRFWEIDEMPASMWTDEPFERFGVHRRGPNGEATSAVAFINGNEAYKYDLMNDEQVVEFTVRALERARPSLKGALEPIGIQSCNREVHGGGDWVFWRPGQVGRFAGQMREAHGNIHFAGEHTALLERGMEGAFESGERAAVDALLRV
ncbi:MAG: FAD-dependent oxidoreductase [Gammaproteobacteria bacterium]|nr:FAD-dependent oxidoreductase [Gammaproteobacteria bacterium]